MKSVEGVTMPKDIRILFAAVRLRVSGVAVAAWQSIVIACAVWPSGRNGMVIGTIT